MAKGYPDFFGVSIFPRYSSYQVTRILPVDIVGGGSRTLFELNTRGIIHGGFVNCTNATIPSECLVALSIDGAGLMSLPFDTALKQGWFNNQDLPMSLTRYDAEAQEHGIIIREGTLFESKFEVIISTWGVGNLSGGGDLYWSEII